MTSETLTPPQSQGMRIRGEGQPIPAPHYLANSIADHLALFGECHRVVVINCCLADVQRIEPDATSYRVAEWINAYLTYYEGLVRASSDPTPAAPDQAEGPQPKIHPALTDKEWVKPHHWIQCYDSWDDEQAKSGVGEISASPTRLTLTSHQCGEFADFSAPTDRHALAALALHGQPFGFTHEDMAALNRAIRALHAEASEFNFMPKHDAESDAAIGAIVRIQERIAALLPPEP